MAKLESVYGLHAVQALLKSAPQRVNELLVLEGRHDQRLKKLLHTAERAAVRVRQTSRKELDKLSDGNHQGVVALSFPGELHDEKYLYRLLQDLQQTPFLLVLDGVTDPHNLGACLRTADAAGVHAVIAPRDKACGLTSTVRKVACGAAETVPFVQVTNLARTLKALQQAGIWIIGTDLDTTQSLYDSDLTGPLALVLGAEGKGLRRLTREACDSLVKLPMQGTVQSLNVSVSAGICLYEALRQRQGKVND